MEDRITFRALGASFSLHILFLLTLALFASRQSNNRTVQTAPILIELQDPIKLKSKSRVVETAEAMTTKEAPDNAYLSEKNQVTERETVAKKIKNLESPSRPHLPKAAPTAQNAALSRFGVAILPKTNPSEFRPAKEETQKWADYSEQSEDFIEGVKEGDRTLLNTKEFVFFSYFKRIRERLDLAWRPLLRTHLMKAYRQGRTLASDRDHTTQTLVVLDRRGEIVRVQVLTESGVKDLDEAAILAFNKAGPFPNPPSGLAEQDGMIRIRWDFVLKT